VRPHIRWLVADLADAGRRRRLAAIPHPAELAGRGLVVAAVVQQRESAELVVNLAVCERRPVGGE
jgi:hypothetical protein